MEDHAYDKPVSPSAEVSVVPLVALSGTSRLGYECSCVVTTDATADQIRQACEDWAHDLRWREKNGSPGSLVFGLALRMDVYDRGRFPDVTVMISGCDGHSRVEFVLDDVRRLHVPISEGPRICETFLRGVCSTLAAAGAAISPSELAVLPQDRARLKRAATRWRLVQIVLGSLWPILLLAWFASMAFLGRDGYPPLGFFAVLAFCLGGIGHEMRERSAGNRALRGLITGVLVTVAWGGLTVLSFYL